MDSKLLAAVSGFFIVTSFPFVPVSGLWASYPTLSNVTVKTQPPNSTAVTVSPNQSSSIKIHFLGRVDDKEDDLRTKITTFFRNGSSSVQSNARISDNIDKLDNPDMLYWEGYYSNSDSHYTRYNLDVNNHRSQFGHVERVAVKVEYIYNQQRNIISFCFDVHLEEPDAIGKQLPGTTTAAIKTVSPTVPSKSADNTAVLASIIAFLGTTCLLLSLVVLVLTCLLTRQDRKSRGHDFGYLSPIKKHTNNNKNQSTPKSKRVTQDSIISWTAEPRRLHYSSLPNLSQSPSNTSETDLLSKEKAEQSPNS